MKDETIELVGSTDTDADGLTAAISSTEPRYSFFRYPHQVEGSEQSPSPSPIVFIYTCPPASKIKERMVYASTKQGFLAAMTSDLGIEIAKKVSKKDEAGRKHGITGHIADWNINDISSSKSRVRLRSLRRRWKRSFGPNGSRSRGFRGPRGLGRGDRGAVFTVV